MNEYAIYLRLDDYEIDAFLHFNDLSYTGVPEELAKNYKLNDKMKVKVLEVKKDTQKVRVGLKQTQKDPFDYFKNKNVNDTVTVKVISSDNKGLIVKPEGSDLCTDWVIFFYSIERVFCCQSVRNCYPSFFFIDFSYHTINFVTNFEIFFRRNILP